MRKLAFAALAIAAIFLRTWQLDQYPLGLHQDELSNIYDGYSLAVTGADRSGARFPAVARGFGDFDSRPALYVWLAAVPERVTGFSIVAGRLPSAVLGIASLGLLYRFALGLAGPGFALATVLFGTFSPLHVQHSRLAHEGAMLPAFFVILILYLWQRAGARKFGVRETVALGLSIGVSANAYQATRLMALLFALAVAADILRRASRRSRALVALGATVLLGALPQIVVLVTRPTQFFGRSRKVVLSAEGPLGYAAEVIRNYWLNLEPRYLFLPPLLDDLTVARLLPPEIVFFYAGLIALGIMGVRQRRTGYAMVYYALVVALLPAALTEGNPNSLRASGVAVLTPMFSAAGLILIAELIRSGRLRQRVYYPLALAGVLLSFGAILYRYSRSEYFRSLPFQKILVDLGRKVGEYQAGFDQIYVERHGSHPHLYLVAFGGMSPREYQTVPKGYYSVGADIFRRVGKYHIVPKTEMEQTIAAVATAPGRHLFVAPVVRPRLEVVDSVAFLEEKLYLMISRSQAQSRIAP